MAVLDEISSVHNHFSCVHRLQTSSWQLYGVQGVQTDLYLSSKDNSSTKLILCVHLPYSADWTEKCYLVSEKYYLVSTLGCTQFKSVGLISKTVGTAEYGKGTAEKIYHGGQRRTWERRGVKATTVIKTMMVFYLRKQGHHES